MVSKTMVKWAGVAAVIALAACGPTGPLSQCVMNPDENQTICSTTQSEPADAGVEQIVQ